MRQLAAQEGKVRRALAQGMSLADSGCAALCGARQTSVLLVGIPCLTEDQRAPGRDNFNVAR
jgi:hypothetical protein